MTAPTSVRFRVIRPNWPRDRKAGARASSIIGVVALVVCAIGGFFDPTDQFYRSYIWATCSSSGMPLGCAWPADVAISHGRRLGHGDPAALRSGHATLPLLLLLFIPIVIGMPHSVPVVARRISWRRPGPAAQSSSISTCRFSWSARLCILRAGPDRRGCFTQWSGDQDRRRQRPPASWRRLAARA